MTRDQVVIENKMIPLNGGIEDKQENDHIERIIDETPEATEEIG